ncbi:MAG: acyl carrier protein [Candidatus Enterenecus sp.]
MFEKLCNLIAEQFGIDAENITADTAFIDDLGADSVDLVDLAMALEDEFGIDEMDEESMTTIITVGDLYKYMQEHLDA